MLAQSPTLLQRLIARRQRISLPRGCSAAERVRRLRRGLCHAATVQTVFAGLDAPTQTALHELSARRLGVSYARLVAQYGPVRSLAALTINPTPQSIAETLILLGWLIPRPATPYHPARYLLPPEVRRWLPRPLAVSTHGPAPTPSIPPVVHASAALLILGAEGALPLRADGRLRRSVGRAVAQRLPMEADAVTLTAWLYPLLHDMGFLAARSTGAVTTLAGQRFLARPAADQLRALQQAWRMSPSPDLALGAAMRTQRGIDWPALRARIWRWASALPADQLIDPAAAYPALARTFGPLANAETHAWRSVDRVPWQPVRAAAIFDAALRGPLRWLGMIEWSPTDVGAGFLARVTQPTLPPDAAPSWRYGAPGEVCIPQGTLDARILDLLPWARWHTATAHHTVYRITRQSLAQAVRQGAPIERLWTLLAAAAGPLPAAWRTPIERPAPVARITTLPVLLTDSPAVLEQAARQRSIRRSLAQRPAPGVALVEPRRLQALQRALARLDIALDLPPQPPTTSTPPAMMPGDAAALLVACAFYRRYAPTGAPLLPDHLVETQLRATLPPDLRTAVDAALTDLAASPHTRQTNPSTAALRTTLDVLECALFTGQALQITYYTASRNAWSTRRVRPLALEQRDEHWYLRAVCALHNAERTFRVDRISVADQCCETTGSGPPLPSYLPSSLTDAPTR
jgi:hypothetical protein